MEDAEGGEKPAEQTQPGKARTVELRVPVQLGSETIERITVKPSSKAFRNFALPMKEDGTILFQPYALAEIGCKMAGQTTVLLDKMDPADMWEVAFVVLSFIAPGRATGMKFSPS